MEQEARSLTDPIEIDAPTQGAGAPPDAPKTPPDAPKTPPDAPKTPS